MCTSQQIAQRLRDFITRTFPISNDRIFDDRTSLLESGIVDSLGILEVVSFLESEFGLILNDDELVAENFDSIFTLTNFVCETLTKREFNGLPDPPLAAK